MGRAAATLAVTSVLLLSGSVLATGAPAAERSTGIVVTEGGTEVEFGLRTGRDETLVVSGTGRAVSVALTHGHGVEGAVSQYATVGRVTDRSIDANFGRLGRISVRVRPQGRPRVDPPPAMCEGGPESTTRGSFVGTIRFRSEDGDYDVDVGRARGLVHSQPRLKCRFPDRKPPPERPPEEILLIAGDCQGRTLAVAVPPDDPAFVGDEQGAVVLASASERRGRILIWRFAFALAPRSPLTYASDLSSATLTAPNLFSGSAAFAQGPDRVGTWTGTLTADFPGRELGMAGPSFSASLRRVALGEGVFGVDYEPLCAK